MEQDRDFVGSSGGISDGEKGFFFKVKGIVKAF